MYELTDAYKRLMEAAEGVDHDVFEDTLQSIQDGIEDKAQGYAAVIAELQGDVDKRKKEIARITAQKQSLESRIKRMKDNLYQAMKTAGVQKVKGRYTVTIRRNAPHAVIIDEDKIPGTYIQTINKYDMRTLTDLMKQGYEVPGAELKQSQSIQIR
ncbi:siphovirus Gp157 family protein [Sporolactobacillus sp. KGMB 08714]|uniref:siphovirus Gp157 family protein n=1 Tax=Sporolactobacillus sp. KGMB 08714 TaxID=3064704 RepID=UPI002FBD2FCC